MTLAKRASLSLRLTCVNSRHTRDPSSQPVPPLSAVPGILSVTTRLCRFHNRYVQLRRYSCFFSRSERGLWCHNNIGRLQVLVVDTHYKRKLFSTKTDRDLMSLPDAAARRITALWWCMQQPISVPHGTCAVATAANKGSRSAISTCRTGCRRNNKGQRPRQKQEGTMSFLFKN